MTERSGERERTRHKERGVKEKEGERNTKVTTSCASCMAMGEKIKNNNNHKS